MEQDKLIIAARFRMEGIVDEGVWADAMLALAEYRLPQAFDLARSAIGPTYNQIGDDELTLRLWRLLRAMEGFADRPAQLSPASINTMRGGTGMPFANSINEKIWRLAIFNRKIPAIKEYRQAAYGRIGSDSSLAFAKTYVDGLVDRWSNQTGKTSLAPVVCSVLAYSSRRRRDFALNQTINRYLRANKLDDAVNIIFEKEGGKFFSRPLLANELKIVSRKIAMLDKAMAVISAPAKKTARPTKEAGQRKAIQNALSNMGLWFDNPHRSGDAAVASPLPASTMTIGRKGIKAGIITIRTVLGPEEYAEAEAWFELLVGWQRGWGLDNMAMLLGKMIGCEVKVSEIERFNPRDSYRLSNYYTGIKIDLRAWADEEPVKKIDWLSDTSYSGQQTRNLANGVINQATATIAQGVRDTLTNLTSEEFLKLIKGGAEGIKVEAAARMRAALDNGGLDSIITDINNSVANRIGAQVGSLVDIRDSEWLRARINDAVLDRVAVVSAIPINNAIYVPMIIAPNVAKPVKSDRIDELLSNGVGSVESVESIATVDGSVQRREFEWQVLAGFSVNRSTGVISTGIKAIVYARCRTALDAYIKYTEMQAKLDRMGFLNASAPNSIIEERWIRSYVVSTIFESLRDMVGGEYTAMLKTIADGAVLAAMVNNRTKPAATDSSSGELIGALEFDHVDVEEY